MKGEQEDFVILLRPCYLTKIENFLKYVGQFRLSVCVFVCPFVGTFRSPYNSNNNDVI